MFTLNSFADVVAVAKTFGRQALHHALDNKTVSPGTCMTIIDCFKWSNNSVIHIESVNDGNNEYEVKAVFSTEEIAGLHITGIDNIRISRVGYGSFHGSVQDAMAGKYITAEQLGKVLAEIAVRNEARTAFNL